MESAAEKLTNYFEERYGDTFLVLTLAPRNYPTRVYAVRNGVVTGIYPEEGRGITYTYSDVESGISGPIEDLFGDEPRHYILKCGAETECVTHRDAVDGCEIWPLDEPASKILYCVY